MFAVFALFAVLIAAADQLVKYLVVENIPLFGEVPLLPGVLKLTLVHNEGAAYSSFRGMQWLFALIFVLFLIPCGHGLLEPGSQGAGAGLFGTIGLFQFAVLVTPDRPANGGNGGQAGEEVGLLSGGAVWHIGLLEKK